MADSANLKSLLSPKAMAGGFATTRTDSAQFSIKPRLTKEASSSVQKRRQLFIRTHNETLSVIAMRVSNPDRSPSLVHTDRARIVFDGRAANDSAPDGHQRFLRMFYGTQTAQRDRDDGGGLGPLVITPTITSVPW